MVELEQLERELLVRHPERWVRHHLASFPADYLRDFDSTEVSRDLDAMITLTTTIPCTFSPSPRTVVPEESTLSATTRFSSSRRSAPCWRSPGCRFSMGEFSHRSLRRLIRRLDSQTGARPRRAARPSASSGPDRRPRIVDVFRVRPVSPQPVQPDWEKFQDELTT